MIHFRFDDLMFEKDYGMLSAYDYSKLANVMFSKELGKRLNGMRFKWFN